MHRRGRGSRKATFGASRPSQLRRPRPGLGAAQGPIPADPLKGPNGRFNPCVPLTSAPHPAPLEPAADFRTQTHRLAGICVYL